MFSSPLAPSDLYSTLDARPPTPPKDVTKDVDDALRFLTEGHDETKDNHAALAASNAASLSTTPLGSPALLDTRGSTATKKVDFSPLTIFHPHPQPIAQGPLQTGPPRHAPPARVSKPLKSILKASVESLPPTPDDLENKLCYFSPQEPDSFRKMLQSVLQQLGGTSRDGRRDAYLALNGALKAYEGVPDPQAMVEKMPLLQQFVTRDMAWRDAAGKLDSSIITQALNLTCVLLYSPHTSPALDDDFKAYLIDRSTTMLEQPDTPKAIAKLHMYLLSQQRFANHIMTASRADKLVTAVQGIEDRCSGNSIISARLISYQRLMEQQPSIMLKRMRDWIEHVFHGLLSSIDDTRIRAIETCSQAGLYLGAQPQASTILFEICSRNMASAEESGEQEVQQEHTYGEYFTEKLHQMTLDKDRAPYAPQIWAAVILLLRNKRRPIEKWPMFKPWLATMQRSLNSADLNIKQQANVAWNKLVFAVMPDASTPDVTRSMLKVPIEKGLEKRGSDRTTVQLRQLAMDSYCNLLHYALRPTLSHEELDKAWDLYVDPVLRAMIKSGSKPRNSACHVLYGLLRKSDGVWNANAALLIDPIKPDDLPRLDAKWLRSRLGKVLRVLEPVIQSTMCSGPDGSRAPDACWRLLLQAIAEAGVQEVKTSSELKEALAQLTNFFRRLWTSVTLPGKVIEGSVWIQRYQSLLGASIDLLGQSRFVEDMFFRTQADDVEVAPTPSHRSGKHSRIAYPPFVFLFALYYQAAPALQVDGLRSTSASWFLGVLAGIKGTVSGTIGLLHRALQFSSSHSASLETRAELWTVVAETMRKVLSARKPLPEQHDTQVMGVALKSALNVAVVGLPLAEASGSCEATWVETYKTICDAAKHYGREGGVALGVMEPFAKTLLDTSNDMNLDLLMRLSIAMLRNSAWPKSRQDLDRDRKALWAISLDPPKSSTFDPFDHVYALTNTVLKRAYDRFDTDSTSIHTDTGIALLRTVTEFIHQCPRSLLPRAYRRLQPGPVIWFGDVERRIFPKVITTAAAKFSYKVHEIGSSICKAMAMLPKKDSAALEELEPLLCALFSSPSRDIVNSTILFWNASFGSEPSLEYPPKLHSVFRARRTQAQIELPNFAEGAEDVEIAALPEFAETETGSSSFETGLDTALKSTPRLAIPEKPRQVQLSSAAAEPAGPATNPRRSNLAATPTARLRHDDSQVEFAPIETSPKLTREESQLLTDHQKEVKTRQHGDAQMFPELSSSPAPKSVVKTIAKKLNFVPRSSIEQEQGTSIVTPTGLVDGNPMSDDLPSSPTPKAMASTRSNQGMANNSDEDDNETIVDPPSSPPRQDGDEENAPMTEVEDFVGTSGLPGGKDQPSEAVKEPTVPVVAMETHDAEDNEDNYTRVLDLPSDTTLPAEQLEREAEAAAAAANGKEAAATVHRIDAGAATAMETPRFVNGTVVRSVQDEDQTDRAVALSGNEDSGAAKLGQDTSAEVRPEVTCPRRTGRKRKQTFETVHVTKKKIKTSTFKSFFSRLTGSSQEEEGDDIEDEIVVASQTRSPVTPGRAGRSHPELDSQEVLQAAEAEEGAENQKSTEPMPQVKRKPGRPKRSESQACSHSKVKELISTEGALSAKRKRGRPRKSDSQQSSQVDSQEAQRLQRRISRSSMSITDEQPSTSFIADTPAASKPRKSSRHAYDDIDASSALRRRATEPSASVEEDEIGDNDLCPAKKITNEQSENGSISGRKIAKPKSILGRLRGMLADCKKMVLGSRDEEREFDDILFEIRREVHAAGMRGKEMDDAGMGGTNGASC